jgi:uncharacterized membrane-anchored protein YhcB (DUF1043 family)
MDQGKKSNFDFRKVAFTEHFSETASMLKCVAFTEMYQR